MALPVRITRSISRCFGALLVVSIAGAAPAQPVTVTDGAGQTVTISDSSRIVSIGGAVTEILYALGRSDRIVAVDTTSVYPPQALKEKPNVGYQRQLSPEGVLAMRPSLLLAIEGSGPKEAVQVLETAGIPFVHVPDHYSGEGVIQKIRLIAQATGAAERGECLVRAVSADLEALDRLRSQIARPARVMFVLSMAGDRLLVAGNNTAAEGIIRLAGAVNAVSGFDGYKAINEEAIIGARPDAILVMRRGEHTIKPDALFAHPAFRMTPAAEKRTLLSFEGLYLLGFGPRTPAAARELATSLYPQLAGTQPPSPTSGAAGCDG